MSAERAGNFALYEKEGSYLRQLYSVRFSRRMKTIECIIQGVEEGRSPVTQWKGYNNQLAEKKKPKAKFKPIRKSHCRRPRVPGS